MGVKIQMGRGGGWEALGRDWTGEKVDGAGWYALTLAEGFLEISARRNVGGDVGSRDAGSFVEGLWKRDVVELFLGLEGSENYLEFHIAPDGCWWVGGFSGEEREAVWRWESGFGPEGFSSSVEKWGGKGWCATLRVPQPFLEQRVGGDVRKWRGNVTAMVRDEGGRRYVTANRPPPGLARPDFHRRELRQEMEIRGGGEEWEG